MEKEENKNSITDNTGIVNDAEKRVLVVGKLKGIKEEKTKKTPTKKANKTKTTKTATKETAKEQKVKTAAATKSVAKKTETISKVSKDDTKKSSSKKEEKPKAAPKKETTKKVDNAKKEEVKKDNPKTTKNKKETAKKVESNKEKTKKETEKKAEPKNIKIVEKFEKTEKTTKPSKSNKTKKASAQANVLRVDIKSEEFRASVKNVIIAILTVSLIVSLIYIGNIGRQNISNKMLYSSLSKDIKMEELINKGSSPTDAIKTLQQENPEIQGWIKIDGTNVNYPLLQGKDNKYYLTHNFKDEKTSYGSIFVNTNSDLKNDKANVIIYGHDMKDGQMFSDLIKYTDKEYYDAHKTIKITTNSSENEYTIVSVFKSKVFYKDEKNVFRFYQYYNLENEKQFNEYISNCKKLQLYDTGVEANYGDQLVTLITCEYSNDNGRMVVVAKKK